MEPTEEDRGYGLDSEKPLPPSRGGRDSEDVSRATLGTTHQYFLSKI